MKKIIKKIFLFSIIILSIFFTKSLNTYALTKQNTYVKINETDSLNVGDLLFSNIQFKDYSSISTKAFGLTGIVSNVSKNDINYSVTVNYYDKNLELIAKSSSEKTAILGSDDFSQMSNLSILGNHSVSDIYYYTFIVTTVEESSIKDNTYSLTPSDYSEYSKMDYVIDSYDIDIVVNENETFDITEKITTYFNVSKHGIYRNIPLKNTIKRLDGSTGTNRAKVTNLEVNKEYTTSVSNENYVIKIGSTNYTLTEKQDYVIKYTYSLSKDNNKDYDELYLNIIGVDWDTVIGNVTFKITMPKSFDSSKLGFSAGSLGSTNSDYVKYNVKGNVITGSYNGILGIGEGISVRCELPEGYFENKGLPIDSSIYIMAGIPLLCLIIAVLLWFKFGRDDKVIETVEFYPPEGFNSLEVAYLYKGEAKDKDVTSLLIYLANKGYIKIVETEEKNIFSSNKGFKLIKLKDYDGDNINERLFLQGLFGTYKQEVISSDLEESFYVVIDKILDNINKKDNKNKLFEKSNSFKSVILVILMIITLLSMIVIPTLNYGDFSNLVITLLLLAFYTPFYAIGIFGKFPLVFRVFWLGFTIIHSGIFFFTTKLFVALTSDIMYLICFIFGILCLAGMIVCFKLMPKRTPYGNEMLGKIKGFKNFLETAEKDKLESMVMQNPTYFYDILPYTYVLGVSDKWISKFETLAMRAPDWYEGYSTFNVTTFNTFMTKTMSSAQNSMTSRPSSSYSGGSSSGGSSGGGSSGGGSGGGGGGSW